MTRTMRQATWAVGSWDEQFRKGWVRIACDLGEAIADPDGDVAALQDNLDTLVTKMSQTQDLPHVQWPIYGAMLASLRHIIFSDIHAP